MMHRPLRAADEIRRAPRRRVDPGPGGGCSARVGSKNRVRVVVRLGLDVLRQGEERRAAGRRIEHHGQRLRQRADDLGGLGDPVPVAADRLERVGHGDRRVAEVLDLLQDGVDDPVLERVARQEQDRQPVGVGDGGGGHHVRRARPDRRGRDHDPPAAHRLGVGHGGQRHRLLVLAAPRRQPVLDRLERLGRGDVTLPWPKIAKTPAKIGTSSPSIRVRCASSQRTMAWAVVSRIGLHGSSPRTSLQVRASSRRAGTAPATS